MSSEPQSRSTAFRSLASGACALVVAMGISRFGYTPLVPMMQRGAGLTTDAAGLLASFNFAGYLLGAFAVAALPGERRSGRGQLMLFHAAIAGCVVFTAGMALTEC